MVFVTGDCHGNFRRFQSECFPEQANMTKGDTVIIAGDFGGVWFGDSRDDETLDWLERLPFTLAFVCGNHENYDALERYPVAEWHGGKVHRVRPHVLHLMRGQIFELDGYLFFTMGGAKSHDIEDGILEPDAPDFERRLTMRQRKPRARQIGSQTFCKRCRKEQNTTTGCSATTTTTEPLMKSTSCCGSRSCESSEAGQSREKHGDTAVPFSALSVDQARRAGKEESP